MASKATQTDPANEADKASSGKAAAGQEESATGPGQANPGKADPQTAGAQSDPAAAAAGSAGRGAASTELLKEILEGFLKTSELQSDYQALYRSLPTVVGIAAEVLKQKEAGDTAFQEGMKAVERVLGEARDKAEQLSSAMTDQQSALDKLLNDKGSLMDLLKASQQHGGKTLKGGVDLGGQAALLADPKIAFQLNTLMGNINGMVSREVARQLAGLRAKASGPQA